MDLIERIEKARRDLADARTQINELMAKAEGEGRELSDEEMALTSGLQAQYEGTKARLELMERQEAMNQEAKQIDARLSEPDPPKADAPDDDKDATATAPQGGTLRAFTRPFESGLRPGGFARDATYDGVLRSKQFLFEDIGEFARAVRVAAMGAPQDRRLKAAAEHTGAEGGFLVPPAFSQNIMDLMFGEETGSVMQDCMQIPMSSNSLTIPLDMTTPYRGGVRAYWEGEGQTHQASDINVETATLRLHKLTAYVPVTEELLEDSAAIGPLLTKAASESIRWEVDNAIINGSGRKSPAGIMGSNALISAAADSNQTADTITASNLATMWSHLPEMCKARAVWLIAPNAEPQLQNATIGQYPVLVPAGGGTTSLASMPNRTIYGRPVRQHLACQTLGNLGDILLCDFSQYYWGMRTAGGMIRSAVSMHLLFDRDMALYKFQLRGDGQSAWSDNITVANGSHELSPFVALTAR